MTDILDETSSIESTTVGIYRTAATVKGGRRFSFGALVVVGDRRGRVGLGYAKANQVPPAIEKAQKEGKRKMRPYALLDRTVPHESVGRFGACIVKLIPASPGTGVIAGAAVRAVLEMVGIQDCLTKCYGSNNPKNIVKATFAAMEQLRLRESVERLRGVELPKTAVEEAIERGKAFMALTPRGEKVAVPVNTVADERRGRRGPARRGGRGGPPMETPEGAPAAGEARTPA